MPPNLPDARTAQRLLDVLSLLEQTLRNGRSPAASGPVKDDPRLAELQAENRRLRTTRQQASQRLGALLERLGTQLETAGQPAETPFNVITNMQDHAA